MGDIGSAIKYLYSQFILRDVLSFITPGAIIVVTATYLLFPNISSYYIHWPLYIPIFGFFYMIGFALQCLGELFGVIYFTPYSEKNFRKRWSMFYCCNLKKNIKNMWWQREEKKLSDFYEKSKTNEGVRQGHERMVVMKQMCANGFMAILIAGVFIAVNLCPYKHANIVIVSLVAFFLFISLFWGYRVHMFKQNIRERIFMKRPEDKGADKKS